MSKKDKYAHIPDEALRTRLQRLDEGQGWTETDPLYKRLKANHMQLPLSAQKFISTMWARKAQQMRLRRELTQQLKIITRRGYVGGGGVAERIIKDIEELQVKFKEWQAEVETLLNEKI